MPTTDAKFLEISRLKNKLVELEQQLTEEKKVSLRLREQNEKRNEQIGHVDNELAAEMERYRWKKEEILFQLREIEEDSKANTSKLRAEEIDLLQDIADFDMVQMENEKLHSKLKQAAMERKTNAQAYATEKETKKQKDFDIRMKLEEILRKTIKNLDQTYERDAISKMQYEASQAHIENIAIHTEFDKREAMTEALIRQQQQSYDQLMKLKIQRDVLLASSDIQEQSIQRLISQNNSQARELHSLALRVQKMKDEIEVLSDAVINREKIESDLTNVRTQTKLVQREIDKLKKETLNLGISVVKECIKIGERERQRNNEQIALELNKLSGEDLKQVENSLEQNLNNNDDDDSDDYDLRSTAGMEAIISSISQEAKTRIGEDYWKTRELTWNKLKSFSMQFS